jgi:hypothetical protein
MKAKIAENKENVSHSSKARCNQQWHAQAE